MDLIYHGRSPSDDRWEMAKQGKVPGSTFSIYEVDAPDPAEERDYRAKSVYDLPGGVVDERSVSVTGGFTGNIGAAAKFHQTFSEIGAVFLVDRGRLRHHLEKIEYDHEWAEGHPGTYARIDSIDDFEIYRDGELVGAGYHRRDDDLPIVNKWTEQLRSRIDNFAYADEAELAEYGETMVNFRRALFGTASYMHVQKAVGGSIQGALAEYDGFEMGFGRNARIVTDMDHEEMALAFHEAFTRDHGGGVIGRSHMVVLYDDDRKVRDATERVPEDEFVLATDGQTVYRDPSDVSEYLGA